MGRIEDSLKLWKPNLGIEMPIRSSYIKGFKQWIHWNTFRMSRRGELPYHPAYDFIAYYDQNNQRILGLPHKTEVSAITAGTIAYVDYCDNPDISHYCHGMIVIKHNNAGLASEYLHVNPLVEAGQEVIKGEKIATVSGIPNIGSDRKMEEIIHLHFALGLCEFFKKLPPRFDYVNPLDILPEFSDLYASPLHSLNFKVVKRYRK